MLGKLDLTTSKTKLLAIVASKKGGSIAADFDKVNFLGYPFSFSPTFLEKNINSTIEKSIETTEYFQNLCAEKDKTLLQYISMAFGNPYGDKWSEEMLFEWVDRFYRMGIKHITLSDITAEASPGLVFNIYNYLIKQYPTINFGIHLHTSSSQWRNLVDAAYKGGCRNFDTVNNGMGGCPMSGKDLLQNLNTYDLLSYLTENGIKSNISIPSLNESLEIAGRIFP